MSGFVFFFLLSLILLMMYRMGKCFFFLFIYHTLSLQNNQISKSENKNKRGYQSVWAERRVTIRKCFKILGKGHCLTKRLAGCWMFELERATWSEEIVHVIRTTQIHITTDYSDSVYWELPSSLLIALCNLI